MTRVGRRPEFTKSGCRIFCVAIFEQVRTTSHLFLKIFHSLMVKDSLVNVIVLTKIKAGLEFLVVINGTAVVNRE